MDSQQHEPMFTCKDCGSQDLKVFHEFTRTTHHTSVLACDCAWNTDGIAAVKHYSLTTRMWESGYLDEHHHWEYVEGDDVDQPIRTHDAEEVICDDCLEEIDDDDPLVWETQTDEESEIDDERYDVHCAGCNREIEFGWSFPDRTGRIWPVECSDFSLARCYPEPQYHASWVAKGWIVPRIPGEGQ